MIGVIQNISDILVLILLFGATIFVHELGHFIVARKLGMVVDVFSIGFGPAIWKKKYKGVVYKISIIPLGGYVSLPQLDPSGMSTLQGSQEKGADDNALDSDKDEIRILPPVSPWKKILVSVAGSIGNVAFAILLAWVIYMNPHSVTGADSTTIGTVLTNSVAYESGIRPGDRIVAVNSKDVSTWYRFSEEALLGADKQGMITLTLENNEQTRDVDVPIVTNQFEGLAIPGVGSANRCAVVNVDKIGIESNGFHNGDIIKSINGIDVVSCQHLEIIAEQIEAEIARITVIRGDEEVSFDARIPDGGTAVYTPCLIGGIVNGAAADKAGLKTGDLIREFNGIPIADWSQFTNLVDKAEGRAVSITVEREARLIEAEVTPEHNEQADRALIGIRIGVRPTLPWMRFRSPSAQVKNDASGIVRVLKALISPKRAKRAAGAIGGPFMILLTLWGSIKISIFNAVGFLRFLNVNLAIINLLPIPVLDGGHIIFSLWEGITRRKIPPKVVNIMVNFFMALLLGLMLLITIRDIGRWSDMRGKGEKVESSEHNVDQNPAD